jgi:uncharacterized damage-inducible protein DinB
MRDRGRRRKIGIYMLAMCCRNFAIPASSMLHLLLANRDLLRQGIDLLSRHGDATYCRSDPATYGSGIGPHFRHVLDHYKSFVAGWKEGLIDYDNRVRDTRMETDRAAAIAEFEGALEALSRAGIERDGAVDVVVSASASGPGARSRSSIARELQFLVSHTVHHYALIAIASRILGVAPGASFGVAPSTLKYLQTAER